jgi:hypothetical protein
MVQLSGNCQLPYQATVGCATVVGQLSFSSSVGQLSQSGNCQSRKNRCGGKTSTGERSTDFWSTDKRSTVLTKETNGRPRQKVDRASR